MHRTLLLLACIVWASHGRRLHSVVERLQRIASEGKQRGSSSGEKTKPVRSEEHMHPAGTSVPCQACEALRSVEVVAAFNFCVSGVGRFKNNPTLASVHSPVAKQNILGRCLSLRMQTYDKDVDKLVKDELSMKVQRGDTLDEDVPMIAEQVKYPPPPLPEGLPEEAIDFMRIIPTAKTTSWGIPDVSTGCYPDFERRDDWYSPSACYNKVEKARYDKAFAEYDLDRFEDLAAEDPSGVLNEWYEMHDLLETADYNIYSELRNRSEIYEIVENNPPEWTNKWPLRNYPFPKSETEYMFLFREVRDIYEDYPLSDEDKKEADRIMDMLYWFQWEFDDYIKVHSKVGQAAWIKFTPVDDAMQFVMKHKVFWEPPPKNPKGWVNTLPKTLTDNYYDALIKEFNGDRDLTEEQVRMLARAYKEGWSTEV
mmetsp:Transcript_100048/g.173665  ORF Transcript_100048/g.173665 Transcript_100048/m.173665 type:complete len:425 (+) Transcript_100048:58-1332(+)